MVKINDRGVQLFAWVRRMRTDTPVYTVFVPGLVFALRLDCYVIIML